MKNSKLINIEKFDFPLIKITNSKNNSTGTATFVFCINKKIKYSYLKKIPFFKAYLKFNKELLMSKHIKIYFKKGNPFLLLFFFVFKNRKEWEIFHFFFYNYYLKNT
jgi:hypothetical protein